MVKILGQKCEVKFFPTRNDEVGLNLELSCFHSVDAKNNTVIFGLKYSCGSFFFQGFKNEVNDIGLRPKNYKSYDEVICKVLLELS